MVVSETACQSSSVLEYNKDERVSTRSFAAASEGQEVLDHLGSQCI